MTSTQVYITDKTGKRFFNTNCSVGYTAPEVRNMQRHLNMAHNFPEAYKFIDLASARIVDESIEFTASDEELLMELGV